MNCCSRHCVHNVYGVERKNTSIEIPAEKLPRAFIEIDQKNEVDPKNDDTKYIKITAVDQYGVGWTMKDKSAIKIENLSFPGKDTCEMTDDTGMNWKTETLLPYSFRAIMKTMTGSSATNFRPKNGTAVLSKKSVPIS